jgi:hypothetical protein
VRNDRTLPCGAKRNFVALNTRPCATCCTFNVRRTSVLHPWAEVALGRDMFAEFSPLKRVSPDPITVRTSYFLVCHLCLSRILCSLTWASKPRIDQLNGCHAYARVQGSTTVGKDQCAPVLILHGSADKDVPSDQGKLFYAALQRLGVESSLVLYKGAGHSVSGRDQMIDAASRVVVHFGDHLQLDPAIVAHVSSGFWSG